MEMVAEYHRDGVSKEMWGNPLIETLDCLKSPHDTVKDLRSKPEYDHEYIRNMPNLMRMLDMSRFEELYLPPEIAGSFANTVDLLIRAAYARRNPLRPEVMAYGYDVPRIIRAQGAHKNTLAGMVLLVGNSGMGKTRLVRTVLARIPQRYIHKAYMGAMFAATQVTWISVDAPVRGSQRSLMLKLLAALDDAAGLTGTKQSYADAHIDTPLDKLIQVFATAATTYHLGVLHVDDLQRISELRSEKYTALQFIIQLANAVKCPVIFSGTPEIEKTYGDNFEAIRRICSGGSFRLERTPAFGDKLARAAFKFQWTDEPVEPTENDFVDFRRYTQDVTSVTLLLYQEAQRLALLQGHKQLMPRHFQEAYKKSLRPMHKALSALRKGGALAEARYEDRFPRPEQGT
jgi:hypothetical protein